MDPFADHLDLTVLGGPVRVHRMGEQGPPVVLLHGAMLDTARGVFRRTAPALAADHRVHVVDLPRHGASRPWRGTLDDAFFRRFVPALLDALELDRAALGGLSMGGGIATGVALDHPDRVTALVAVGPGGIGAKRPAQLLTWLYLRAPGALRLTAAWLARRPQDIRASMERHLVQGAATPDFDEILALAGEEARAKAAHGEGALDDWQVHAYGPLRMRLDLLPALPRMRVPTLWVRGDRDELVGHDEMAAAAAATPGSRLVTMPDAGHIVTYDQPEAFTRLVRGFLAEHVST